MYRFRPDRLRAARRANGLRYEAVALPMNRSARTICGWEAGEAVPNVNQLADLAELLGCHPGDLFEEVNK